MIDEESMRVTKAARAGLRTRALLVGHEVLGEATDHAALLVQ